jgi:hypothetical protein
MVLNSLRYRSRPSRRLEMWTLTRVRRSRLRDMSRGWRLVHRLMHRVCLMRRRMLLPRSCRLRLKSLHSATEYCHMLPHGLEVGGPMTDLTKSSSHELKSLILVARLRCFAGTSRTLCSSDSDLLYQSHHVPVALLKITAQLIDNIAHPPQLLILHLQLPLELKSQTALNLPHDVSRLHLGAGLCCQSTRVLRSLRL